MEHNFINDEFYQWRIKMMNISDAFKMKRKAHKDFRKLYRKSHAMFKELRWIKWDETPAESYKHVSKLFNRINALNRGVKSAYRRSQLDLSQFAWKLDTDYRNFEQCDSDDEY